MKKKILVTAPLDFLIDLKETIANKFEVHYFYQSTKNEIQEILINNIFDAWLVAPCPTYFVDGEMVDLCPSLKIISTPSTGTNHLNVDELLNRKIQIFSLKGSEVVENIFASSEFTFNLLISTIRKTPYAFLAVKDGKWREVEGKYRGRELNGLTVGIIGFGRIGGNLAKYCLSFGMKVLAYDPYVDISNRDVTQCDSLEVLLSSADVIAPCVHLDKDTFHMMNKSTFSLMKDGSYFINTSRGDVVNEDDLIECLKSGKILAAGVDVISDEYLGDKDIHPLINYMKTNNNLIITPHMAGLTFDSERKAQTAAYEAIEKCLGE
jgi:phosphoglycerate dehydrogenase-like enzyme